MSFKIPVAFLTILFISIGLSSLSLAQTVSYPKDLAKWIVTAPPKPETNRWYAANYSRFEWKVSLRREKVAVSVFDQEKSDSASAPLPFSIHQSIFEATAGDQFSTQVDDGWIIGFNGGEWGGSLWWYSPRGDKHYLISKDQISGFFHTRVGLLALEGLAHLSLNDGQIIHLHKDAQGRWKSRHFVNLNHAPQAATQDTDGSLIIATTNRLLRVHLDKRIEVLLPDAFWDGFYPNSLIITPSKEIYIGMRHGVARIPPRAKKSDVQWLLPNRDFVYANRNFDGPISLSCST